MSAQTKGKNGVCNRTFEKGEYDFTHSRCPGCGYLCVSHDYPTLQPSKRDWELVKEIMQAGFDVSMGGDPFKSEEENKEWQEKEYDKAVEKYSSLIAHIRSEAVEEERERIKDEVEKLSYLLYTNDTPTITADGKETVVNRGTILINKFQVLRVVDALTPKEK